MNPIRALARDRRTSIPALLLLALGVAGFAWLLGLQRSLRLRSLPVPDPERLVSIRNGSLDDPKAGGTPSPGELEAMRAEAAGTFTGIAAYASGNANLGGEGGGLPETVKVDQVTANAFQVLGVSPALGRDFNAQDELPGQDGSLILSDAFWRSHLGADPSAVGRTLRLDGRSFVVAGVLPAGFRIPWGAQLFRPLALTPEQRAGFSAHYLNPFGRLKEGADLRQGREAMVAAAERFKQDRRDLFASAEDLKYTFATRPLLDDILGGGMKVVEALGLAGLLVLLLAALNASAMLLARAQGRRRELAIRSALGAAPARLRVELLGEGAWLGFLGAGLGLALAVVGLGAAGGALQWSFPDLDLSGLRVDAWTAAAALLFGPLLGALCALSARIDRDPAGALKEGGRTQSLGSRRLRKQLVLAQLVLATVLLGVATWLHFGVQGLLRARLGLEPAGVWTFSLSPSRELRRDPARLGAVAQGLVARLRGVPGVQAAGVLNNVPMSGLRSDLNILADGRRFDPQARCATPGALEALGIRLLQGRSFTSEDRADGQPIALLTRGLAREIFGARDPLGQVLALQEGERRVVVGVVEDYREFGPAQASPGVVIVPYSQGGALWNATLHAVVRSQGAAPSLRDIRALVHEVAPELGVLHYAPLQAELESALGPQRMARAFFMVFALLALLLAAGGVYGLMAATVAQRQGEFGIRAALGATAADLLALVMGEAAALAALGVLLGLGLGFLVGSAGARWFQDLPPSGPGAPLLAAALLLVTALAATLMPALRAARVDPMTALRTE